jgi:hypothetical protein
MSQSPPELLDEPEALLFETSPFGNLDAIVQHDNRSVYLYLNERPVAGQQRVYGTRACWVRNLAPGPLSLNQDQMQQGVAPMLPRTQTVDRDGQPLPNPDELSLIWLEEGNGVALIEGHDGDQQTINRDQVLAVIPPWSGVDGFAGYAAGCAVETPVAWPMPENPALLRRINEAHRYWMSFGDTPDPFSQLQPQLLEVYQELFEADDPPDYFSIDGGKFPPRGLVEISCDSHVTWATIGMSVCRQPMVEMQSKDPVSQRRIELSLRLPADKVDDQQRERVRQLISQLAGYPWKRLTWFGAGHTCGLSEIQSGCSAAVLVPRWPETGEPLLEFRGDPVNLLTLVPVNPDQQQALESGTHWQDVLGTR